MSLKKFSIGTLCGIMLLTFTGCGNATSQPTEPTTEQVEDADLTLQLTFWNDDKTEPQDPVEKQGKFTGTLIDEKPSGEGKFVTQNSAGEEWYYEGQFTDGTITGQGGCYWTESGYQEVGTYENGLFVPTKAEFFDNTIRWYSSSMFKKTVELNDTTLEFLQAHENIFPATTEETKSEAMNLVDSSIEYKHLSKSTDDYLEKLIYFKNQELIQTEEFTMWGHTVTRMLTSDQNYTNHHFIFYDGSIDVFDGDNITFVSLPIGSASFNNVGGGTTNVIVSIASVVLKN